MRLRLAMAERVLAQIPGKMPPAPPPAPALTVPGNIAGFSDATPTPARPPTYQPISIFAAGVPAFMRLAA